MLATNPILKAASNTNPSKRAGDIKRNFVEIEGAITNHGFVPVDQWAGILGSRSSLTCMSQANLEDRLDLAKGGTWHSEVRDQIMSFAEGAETLLEAPGPWMSTTTRPGAPTGAPLGGGDRLLEVAACLIGPGGGGGGGLDWMEAASPETSQVLSHWGGGEWAGGTDSQEQEEKGKGFGKLGWNQTGGHKGLNKEGERRSRQRAIQPRMPLVW